jgi:uncharacterized membrane protein
LRLLAVALGLAVAAIGAVGVAIPSDFLEFGQSLLTPTVVYLAAAVRVVFGVALVWVAPVSRTPKVLRVLGALLIIAGAVTPFIGVEHSRVMLDWLQAQRPTFTRVWAGAAVVLGLFIAYATSRPGRSAA